MALRLRLSCAIALIEQFSKVTYVPSFVKPLRPVFTHLAAFRSHLYPGASSPEGVDGRYMGSAGAVLGFGGPFFGLELRPDGLFFGASHLFLDLRERVLLGSLGGLGGCTSALGLALRFGRALELGSALHAHACVEEGAGPYTEHDESREERDDDGHRTSAVRGGFRLDQPVESNDLGFGSTRPFFSAFQCASTLFGLGSASVCGLEVVSVRHGVRNVKHGSP